MAAQTVAMPRSCMAEDETIADVPQMELVLPRSSPLKASSLLYTACSGQLPSCALHKSAHRLWCAAACIYVTIPVNNAVGGRQWGTEAGHGTRWFFRRGPLSNTLAFPRQGSSYRIRFDFDSTPVSTAIRPRYDHSTTYFITYRDLEIRVKGHSRSLKVVPFDRLSMVSYLFIMKFVLKVQYIKNRVKIYSSIITKIQWKA